MLPLLLQLACHPPLPPATTTPADTTPSATGTSGGTSGGTTTVSSTAPRAVILMIGDGMGFPHVAGGGLYANGATGSLVMETLPHQGRLRTTSLSGTTDSAASATALGTGNKTENAHLAVDPDGAALTSLRELADDAGLATGVVTTDALTGATPGAFLVHTESRYDTKEIVAQITDLVSTGQPSVLLGGGLKELSASLGALDVDRVDTPDALAAAELSERPVVGLFADGRMDYVLDADGSQPSMAELTAGALSLLEDDPAGFFLVVEGARIDHASHNRDTDRVHPETAGFDVAVEVAADWVAAHPHATLIVTADHECGGMTVADTGAAGELPETGWRWGDHTNVDVPIFATGDGTEVFAGARLSNTAVHAVLASAITGEAVAMPDDPELVDGDLGELGAPLTLQMWPTDFGEGFNQLDGLRLMSDSEGLRIGVDGVFDANANLPLVLLDVDYGAGTGLGAGLDLDDHKGLLDGALSDLEVAPELSGLGFDAAIGAQYAATVALDGLSEKAGLRAFQPPWGETTDIWWLTAITNFDDGNVALAEDPARDAGGTGTTEGGWEIFVPWDSFADVGLPADDATLAVVVLLVSADGTWASNQALPPLGSGVGPGDAAVPISSVATLTVAADGAAVSVAAVP